MDEHIGAIPAQQGQHDADNATRNHDSNIDFFKKLLKDTEKQMADKTKEMHQLTLTIRHIRRTIVTLEEEEKATEKKDAEKEDDQERPTTMSPDPWSSLNSTNRFKRARRHTRRHTRRRARRQTPDMNEFHDPTMDESPDQDPTMYYRSPDRHPNPFITFCHDPPSPWDPTPFFGPTPSGPTPSGPTPFGPTNSGHTTFPHDYHHLDYFLPRVFSSGR